MTEPETIDITDIAFGGKAVGRLADGRVCFVPDALPSERVRVRVVRETKRFVEAQLDRVSEASPRRVKPPCPYFGKCGGCSYQHAAHDLQLEIKTNQVREVLRRLGGIEAPPVQPAVASPLPYGYRNRITVHRIGGRIGFHRRDGAGLVDIEVCLLASDAVNAGLMELRRERWREGARTLREHNERFGFHQTNDAVAALLLDAVENACGDGGGSLIDAYCGDGFFANRLAAKFERATGIEWNERSVAQARTRAAANESYIEGDVSERLGEVLAGIDPARATVILDPPSQGVDARVLDLLTANRVARILYVSCNPATLARDIKGLSGTYRLAAATPFDMFPQTAEVEVLAELAPVS
ncbi:MAG: TRAM domain-containing protein [Terrimicrobiaceae bacterium]|nr:TRAM domain-containing protein [Terrimicrobiaceae bacterium]